MPLDPTGMLRRFFGSSSYSQRVGDSSAEPGIDVDIPAGTAVKAVTDGIFVGALSTPNELVEKIRVGGKDVFLDYMHIDPKAFKSNQAIKAGDVLGTVTTKDEPGGTFGGKSYTSTGPHVEFGVYPSGTAVGQDNHPGLDPVKWLQDLVAHKLGALTVPPPVADKDITADLHGAKPSTPDPQPQPSGGGFLSTLLSLMGLTLDAVGVGQLVSFIGRYIMVLLLIIAGAVFFFKGLGRLKVS
jgi:murein DD-endopeptidase MepM/ murein hydrolase activator NlpD